MEKLLDVIEPVKVLTGSSYVLRGVKWMFQHPKFLFLGLLPAILSGLIVVALIVLLVSFSGIIAGLFAPLTSSLLPWIASAVHIAVQVALIAGGSVLGYISFTALALAVGDPIYSKISETIIHETGLEFSPAPFWDSAKDAGLLLMKGIAVALLAFLLGLIPVVGAVLSFVVTWTFTPYFLSEELISRALEPRGIVTVRKRAYIKSSRKGVWGAGVVNQILLNIPFLAILVMPAAVAGAALLSLEMTKDTDQTTPTLV